MLRKLMIGSTALALAAGVMTLPRPASAEPWWVWPAVAGGTAAGFAVGTAAAMGPYDDGYYDSAFYDDDDYAPGFYSAGYYGPAPAYFGGPYGYRCHYVITEQAPDGTGFRERICR